MKMFAKLNSWNVSMNKVGPWVSLLDTVDMTVERSLATLAMQQPRDGGGS